MPGNTPAANTLTLCCDCGAFRGRALDVDQRRVNRVICYCDDCQCFAHFTGHADAILDARGGTDIVQLSQAQLHIEKGAEQLRIMRLTDSGTFRWYVACCKTPLGNTVSKPNIPFIGLIHRVIVEARTPGALDAKVGPPFGSVFAQFAIGGASAVPRGGASLPRVLLRFFRLALSWRLRGDHRRSPLYGFASQQSIVQPQVLSGVELAAVRSKLSAA